VCVSLLILTGALVTSHDAGLSVPDWPTSYGENMFLFPPSLWIGPIFYEHVHRLIASGVGALTVILAVWIGWVDGRRWVRWLGYAALGAVIVQGLRCCYSSRPRSPLLMRSWPKRFSS
jgi:cytochrome c oxidase assembly protein subunit 15